MHMKTSKTCNLKCFHCSIQKCAGHGIQYYISKELYPSVLQPLGAMKAILLK